MPLRAALYLHTVTLNPLEAEQQRLALMRHAAALGLSIVGVYEDYGFFTNGAMKRRLGGAQLLSDSREQKFDVVLVGHLNCVGDTLEDVFVVYQLLADCGVQLEALAQSEAGAQLLSSFLSPSPYADGAVGAQGMD